MKEYIERLIDGNDLTQSDMRAAMDLIMGGEVPGTQIAAFLVALRAKGETVEEVAGGAASMRAHAVTHALPDSLLLAWLGDAQVSDPFYYKECVDTDPDMITKTHTKNDLHNQK